jgi:hypothetical protein
MAHLRQNEHFKLIANCLNTLSVTIFTAGIATPLAGKIWGTVNWPPYLSPFEVFVSCFCFAVAAHLLGQFAILLVKDADE